MGRLRRHRQARDGRVRRGDPAVLQLHRAGAAGQRVGAARGGHQGGLDGAPGLHAVCAVARLRRLVHHLPRLLRAAAEPHVGVPAEPGLLDLRVRPLRRRALCHRLGPIHPVRAELRRGRRLPARHQPRLPLRVQPVPPGVRVPRRVSLLPGAGRPDWGRP
eukprot:7385580-Prymnesium_polylepis.1